MGFYFDRPILTAISLASATLFGYFFTKLYHARMLVIRLKRQGLPVAPGHSFLFGHLLTLKSASEKLPPGAHYQYIFDDIYLENFQKEGIFYLDAWPMSGLFLAVISPNAAITATQPSQKLALNRPKLLPRFFKPITGGPNLFDMREPEWRPWRAAFIKGFNTEHFLSLIPSMVKETLVYRDTLRELARNGKKFDLDTITLRFTMDFMGQTILKADLGAQKSYNTLADFNPFGFLSFAHWYMHWSNGRQMDQYIGAELDRRYNEYKTDGSNTRKRAVINLILQAYLPENVKVKPEKLDAEFRAFAIRQMRLFVFVGHDSTSSTLTYVLHCLSKNPDCLAKIRAEHDEVFGKERDSVPALFASQPHLTNNLPYTIAVIKETLRVFPPAGTSRQGEANENLVNDVGQICPTEKAMIWIPHVLIHHSPKYWLRPKEFLPERWLVEPGHELYPLKGAWRAFEHGGRNCMAQGLVMMELRVVLAIILREFHFQPAYEEWDLLNPGKGGMYRGERAYMIEEGSAHPVEHYPCRVSLRL